MFKSRNKSKFYQNFTKLATLLFLLSIFLMCTEEVPVITPDPEPDPDPLPGPVVELLELAANISGPEEIRLLKEGKVTIELNGSDSTPKDTITDYIWSRKLTTDLGYHGVGHGETLQDIVTKIGEYEYKLTVLNEDEQISADTTHRVTVYPTLLAIISGTKSEPYSENGVTIKLNGDKSIGNVSKYTWSKRNQDNEFIEITSGLSWEETIRTVGLHRYKLEVTDEYGSADTLHDISIISESTFDNAIYFLKHPMNPSLDSTTLCRMDPITFEIEELYTDKRIASMTMSKEPNGKRIVMGIHTVPDYYGFDLHTYDIETGVLERLTMTASGNSWHSSWNPRKNWIAYVEDGRYPERNLDELALVNPDTKEVIYLSGDKTDEDDRYTGFGPSWDALGEKIAMGNTRYCLGSA